MTRLTLLSRIPKRFNIAVSGGSDSMAALDFVMRKSDREFCVLHFNHGTEFGKKGEKLVKHFCNKNGLQLMLGKIKQSIPSSITLKQSPQERWRNIRYEFFEKNSYYPETIICHTLDDAVEQWLFSSFNGNPKIIPHRRSFYVRPFLLTKRKEMREWCENHDIPFLDDPSNNDVHYPRIRIRKEIIPEVLKINPGLYKVIYKKYLDIKYGRSKSS